MKIVHTADWHMSADTLEKCHRATSFLIDRCRELKPDLQLIAGDFWDRSQVLNHKSAVLPAVEVVKTCAEISPVVIVAGNISHDAQGSLEILRELRTRYLVYTAHEPESILLVEDSDGVRFVRCPSDEARHARAMIHCMPYLSKSSLLSGEERSAAAADDHARGRLRVLFRKFNALQNGFAGPKLLVGHLTVAEAVFPSGQLASLGEFAIPRADLELVGADYYALGHIHLNQSLGSRMWYSGSIYHNDFGETGPRYCNTVLLEGHDITVERIEIPSIPLSRHDVRIDAAGEVIDEHPAKDWQGTELRIRLYLAPEQLHLVRDEELRERYSGAHTYKIERMIIPHERARTEELVTARHLRDKIAIWARATQTEIPDRIYGLADELEETIASWIASGGGR
jgi:exonuclease SbcD